MARLTGGRGLTEADALARIAAQAGDPQRRAAADVWLDNNGTVAGLLAQIDALWQDRIVGFNDNLITGSRNLGSDTPTLVAYDDSWPSAAARLIRRISVVLADRAVAVEHIGSTSVPGLPAKDVIDLQVAVRRLSDADAPGVREDVGGQGVSPISRQRSGHRAPVGPRRDIVGQTLPRQRRPRSRRSSACPRARFLGLGIGIAVQGLAGRQPHRTG